MSDAIGAPELPDDPRFASNALRTDNTEALSEAINAALQARTVDEWLAVLEKAGVPCGPINAIDQVLSDPHVLARNMVVTSDDPDSGKLLMAGNPIKMSSFADPETRRPAPKLDADRTAILKELDAKGPG